jgi:hypothetical protein
MYAGVPQPEDPHLLFENAEMVADVVKPNPALGYLYDHAREPKAPRESWIRQAHVATCAELILKDFFRHLSLQELEVLFDPEAGARAARAMSSPRGVLALTFHGGYSTLLRHSFTARTDHGVIIGPLAAAKFRMLDGNDPGAALFAALRTLNEGHAVYVAPDGPFGKPAGSIEVLGATCPVAAGAPFLAYETGCDTVFFTLKRNGRLLAPHVAPGPSRDPDETLETFQARLIGFYRDRIEACLTGDPQNVALAARWGKKFYGAMGMAPVA